ncbi:MAG TPA: DUF885 family protein, partial [Dehalococcoidia bacterium]|nr:DUF885 family protein [Dehalococcoidia bacterium]
MSQIYELANAYVDRWAALDPVGATDLGISGHDREMTDYSPAGHAARADLDRETLAALSALPAADDRDRIAREALAEFLSLRLDQYAAAEHLRELRVIASPLQSIRGCFDLMARGSREDWETIAERLGRVPDALAGYRATLRAGLDRGLVA